MKYRIHLAHQFAGLIALLLLAVSVQAGSTPARGIPVLIYHEIVTDGRAPGETVIHLQRFREQMKWLHEQGYTTLSLGEFTDILRGRRPVPEKAVVLTFDDGWESGLLAVPILEEYGFKASFMIIAGPKGIGEPYLSWQEIQQLDEHPLFEVESQTFDGRTPGKGSTDALFELTESKFLLEVHLQRSIHMLAWPSGWYNEALIPLAKRAGYTVLLSTDDGLNVPGEKLDNVHRTFMDGACDLASFEQTLDDGRYRVCQTTSP